MKAPYSKYLKSIESGLKELTGILMKDFDYVSILSTDSKGLQVRISQHSKSVSNKTMTSERGTVVRVYRNGLYSEYAKHDEKLGRMAAPPFSDVYLETVETAENEGEEPAETRNPGMGGIPVRKFPQRLLENGGNNHG